MENVRDAVVGQWIGSSAGPMVRMRCGLFRSVAVVLAGSAFACALAAPPRGNELKQAEARRVASAPPSTHASASAPPLEPTPVGSAKPTVRATSPSDPSDDPETAPLSQSPATTSGTVTEPDEAIDGRDEVARVRAVAEICHRRGCYDRKCLAKIKRRLPRGTCVEDAGYMYSLDGEVLCEPGDASCFVLCLMSACTSAARR